MRKSAIIILLGYCAFSFAQNLQFSRPFQTFKNNVPIAIVNSARDFFYVLRYNKAVHDFTIEKRAKPTAEIIAFTPLKLDSVNSTWFDYENLDYLFFEHKQQLYFLFEKEVNSKKSIYLKVVDTLSKSSGFIELANLDQDNTWKDFNFSFKRTGESRILIIASQTSFTGATKKTVQLYDLDTRQNVWIKKLPIENNYSGYSRAFECNSSGDLFYVLVKSAIIGYKRKYMNQMQVSVPVFFNETISLVNYHHPEQPVPLLKNVINLNSLQLLPSEEYIIVQGSIGVPGRDSSSTSDLFFFSEKIGTGPDNKQYYTVFTPLADSLAKALTFYDGSDYKGVGDKEYTFLNQFISGNRYYQVLERQEEYFYKELVVWQTNLQTGRVEYQAIVPHKVLSFKNRTRYRNVGVPMLVFDDDQLSVFGLEAAANFKKPAWPFNYHRFKKETNIWRANLMCYSLKAGNLEKKLVYRNTEFDMVPLNYFSSGQKDMVFFLSSGKFEKFAIWMAEPS